MKNRIDRDRKAGHAEDVAATGDASMRKTLSVLVALGAVVALAGAAMAGPNCGSYQTVGTDTLITADVTTPAAPQSPAPPKTEPEG
jgi:hypothetical protein